MRFRIEADDGVIGIENGRIVEPDGNFDSSFSVPGGELRPGLINAHDHLHRNHYGRLGRPPYPQAYAWAADIQVREQARIARGRARSRRSALLRGAWKNLLAGVTTVVHHDRPEPDFDRDFPIRVANLPVIDSLGRADGLPPAGRGPWALHLAEGTDEASAAEVRTLARLGRLDSDLLGVHVVGARPSEVSLLRDSGAAIVWCPSSNDFLFGRTLPRTLVAPGIDVLLGSDSLLTAAGDLLDELRFARAIGHVGDERLEAAVGEVAARRLGLPEPSLRAGANADVAVFGRPLLCASRRDVLLVVVDGAIRVLDLERVQVTGARPLGREIICGGVRRWIGVAPKVA